MSDIDAFWIIQETPFTSGGQVTDIDAFGSILTWSIKNHGAGYTSTPSFHATTPECTCNGVAGIPYLCLAKTPFDQRLQRNRAN